MSKSRTPKASPVTSQEPAEQELQIMELEERIAPMKRVFG